MIGKGLIIALKVYFPEGIGLNRVRADDYKQEIGRGMSKNSF